jgi:RTX calcium-binding nonapeptide repeat (4 copies)/LVIVD repeat
VRVKQRVWIVPVVAMLLLMVGVQSSTANHANRTIVGPIAALGDSEKLIPADTAATHLGPNGLTMSDLAFWGNRAYQGGWHGFRIIDISNPNAPVEVLDYEDCGPNFTGQGDIVVWDRDNNGVADLLVWATNSAASTTGTPPVPLPRTCDGDAVSNDFEGIQIFDISNEADPDRIGSVETVNGTHTLTAVPDPANSRLLIYSNSSSGNGFEVIEIPLANPANPTLLRREGARGSCHDVSVFLGDVLRTICAGGSGTTVYSNDPADGGSLVNPIELYSFDEERDGAQALAHSAAFTWDGERFVIGHEPGGGAGANCATSKIDRTLFYYDLDSGSLLGTYVLPEQTDTENCTTHNFNFIPALNGKDILVSGHYQAGTLIVDFTNPSNIQTIAGADPAPLDPLAIILGGAWSTYWYNGHAYESDITRGLHVFGINIPEAQPGGFRPETFSNPQTQMVSIPEAQANCKGKEATIVGTSGKDNLSGTGGNDIIAALGGNDAVNGKGGKDTVCAGGGKDKVKGKGGNDKLFGQAQNDSLNGGGGSDSCVGGGGKDKATKCEKEKSL